MRLTGIPTYMFEYVGPKTDACNGHGNRVNIDAKETMFDQGLFFFHQRVLDASAFGSVRCQLDGFGASLIAYDEFSVVYEYSVRKKRVTISVGQNAELRFDGNHFVERLYQEKARPHGRIADADGVEGFVGFVGMVDDTARQLGQIGVPTANGFVEHMQHGASYAIVTHVCPHIRRNGLVPVQLHNNKFQDRQRLCPGQIAFAA